MANDEWETPKNFFGGLENYFGKFDVDLASSESNHLCDEYYTLKNSAFDNQYIYQKRIYCNPPYSNITPWCKLALDIVENAAYMEAAFDDCSKKNTEVVMLLPATIGTKVWHEKIFAYPEFVDSIYIVKGRLRFTVDGVSQGTPRFDSCVVYFRNSYSNGEIDFYTCNRQFEDICTI
jgi:phage N-6-adenine-methyltransferase